FDVQLMTEHLRSMGAVEVHRAAFLQALGGCVDLDVQFDATARSVAHLTGGHVRQAPPTSP
ncbi:MAG: hypothetical protein WDZ26_05525, partial [Nitriliruptoraceae bacterium]